MDFFNLKTRLNDIYQNFPEAATKPIIAITGNFVDGETRIADRYYKSIVKAGGIPFIMPPLADKDVIINTLDRVDGLLLTGGGDVNPLWVGEEPSPSLRSINRERDEAELLTVSLAYNRNIPILGICRGIQVLASALGGTVDQDIAEAFSASHSVNNSGQTQHALIKHSQDADRNEPTHTVKISKDTTLYSIYNTEYLAVNSMHHQAVRSGGKRFNVSAIAPDGVIEAIESNEFKPIMGVQWHPEWLEESGKNLFSWLVKSASEFSDAKKLHKNVLTFDSHCDTPMFFSENINFNHRDERILVDLHKMSDGHQDAVTMVAYLPQPKMGETFSSKVKIKNDGPFDYANIIFDKIEDIVKANNRYLSIARTATDLYEDKRKGRKSIMLGIENGLAIEHDLQNLEHFARRGVVYMTLCHNGDNDICDSAKGCNTHNGVSAYGAKVIEEMNHLGIIVDMSHASEKSFYDALDISNDPIVCSHSNCKSLCNVPRNLTDEQLKALADKGGVCQITLYHGFLRNNGKEADIRDVMEHLEHAIKIMGIEHVGLGSDFDGDGGIKGLANSSDMLTFTLELMRRRYNNHDIARIWGGNWMRVMSAIQSGKR
ncbi:MAG: membrane dipeptidase [Prevotella sp.]|nr:membrane dipeptidase [Paraprevotella sp.]MCI6200938.1 membrane dipeptidase [Paraprevotella sp.]MDD5854819.1 membrane dipeptidase [Prevotella sp.]MDY4407770.1 membrane dipeptidase [Prevotella sp.]